MSVHVIGHGMGFFNDGNKAETVETVEVGVKLARKWVKEWVGSGATVADGAALKASIFWNRGRIVTKRSK